MSYFCLNIYAAKIKYSENHATFRAATDSIIK